MMSIDTMLPCDSCRHLVVAVMRTYDAVLCAVMWFMLLV